MVSEDVTPSFKVVAGSAAYWMLIGLAAAAVSVLSPCGARGDTLGEELSAIDRLVSGPSTPFDEAEKRCKGLLAKYTSPEDQGRIYYQLAAIYTQSGMLKPEKAIEWCKKALECPLYPVKQVELYLWWGGAIQVLHADARGDSLIAARREVARPYLMGLRVCLDHNVRSSMPELPPLPGVRYAGPSSNKDYGERKRMADERNRLVLERLLRRRMVPFRDILVHRLAFIYSRLPLASDELRQMAREVLADEQAVDDLMKAVGQRIQERLDSAALGGRRDVTKELTTEAQTRPEASRNDGSGAGGEASPTPAGDGQAVAPRRPTPPSERVARAEDAHPQPREVGAQQPGRNNRSLLSLLGLIAILIAACGVVLILRARARSRSG